jgi:hypothetical protein
MSAKGLRIFLVEDEAMIRMMVADKLTNLAQQAEAAAQMGEWLSLPDQRTPR